MSIEIPLELNRVLSAYLSKESKNVAPLGKRISPAVTAKGNDDLLVSRLQSRTKFIDTLSTVIVVTLIAVIIFLGYLIWLIHQNQLYTGILLTGQGGSVFAAIKALNKIKKEEIYNILILSQFQDANHDERAKIIEKYYQYVNS